MEHFANFGVVKKANKQLKKQQELKVVGSNDSGKINNLRADKKNDANKYDNLGFGGQPIDSSSRTLWRGENRKSLKDRVLRKPKSSEELGLTEIYPRKNEVVPNTKDFTDIRKTTDGFASETGYLGFRTDPYKGLGGMMEEPVDLVSSGRRTPKARIPY